MVPRRSSDSAGARSRVPAGFCHCGCGERTKLAPHNHRRDGWVRGEPLKFVFGHQRRKSPVEFVVADDGCWIWQRGTNGRYGTRVMDGKMGYAHRVAYEREYGPIPEGHDIHHRCRQTLCVNPAHLEAMPESLHASDGKLTFEDVDEIRRRYAAGETQYVIADHFGVTQGNISFIVNNQTWRLSGREGGL